jgi:ribosomal protein L11 methyltransferase
VVHAALLAHDEIDGWNPEIVVSGHEVAEGRPEQWVLEAWLPRRPRNADRTAVAALFGGDAPEMVAEKVPDTDWVTESQRGVEPIRAGCFYVHTPDHPPSRERGVIDFEIPASQAFGTGQHATTAGCLAMLSAMKRRGVIARNLADIGSGTGLLAFAALRLWPGARAVASDIDPVCASVIADNARRNGLAIGARPGQLAVAIAAGMDDRLLRECGPYDLLTANILAGPLIELAVHAIATPGHTPGAMSWYWDIWLSGDLAATIVYADSLTPVSSDGYRFTDHPSTIAAFRSSLAKIAGLNCRLLLSPHPSASGMRANILAHGRIAASRSACKDYAEGLTEALDERLAKEAHGG